MLCGPQLYGYYYYKSISFFEIMNFQKHISVKIDFQKVGFYVLSIGYQVWRPLANVNTLRKVGGICWWFLKIVYFVTSYNFL